MVASGGSQRGSMDKLKDDECDEDECSELEESFKSDSMLLESKELGHIGSLLGALCGDDDLPGPSWLTSCPMSFTAGKFPLAALARGRSVAFKRVGEEGKDTVLDAACQDDTDKVSALQWVETELLHEKGDVGSNGKRERGFRKDEAVALFVGCTSGAIRVYDVDGRLILTQTLHATKAKAFRLRGHGSADRTQDLLVVYEDSVVARIDGATIISALKTHKAGGRVHHLAHCKWKMQSQEGLADAVCCGLDEQVHHTYEQHMTTTQTCLLCVVW